MKRLSVLGSTGSIGRSTLKIVEKFPDRFQIVALAAKKNITLLAEQIKQFTPPLAVVYDKNHAERLKQIISQNCPVKIHYGLSGYLEAASHQDADTVVMAVVGSAGLLPTLAATEARKDIALANKETLVMGGDLVMKKAHEYGTKIFPVDSEHSAVFQCLEGHGKADLKKIVLTASGGPFLNRQKSEFDRISVEDALNHPTWQMGKKISIDSATLMNKGLEIIEARWLFNVAQENIQVLVHPQSIVHSMVAYRDGSVIAQMSNPDMIGAIAYALSYPERLDIGTTPLNLSSIGTLTFFDPDLEKFPCLALAMDACRTGATMPAVLNAANEIAVEAFLEKKVNFNQIPIIIEKVMHQHKINAAPNLEEILQADQWARTFARQAIAK
jgi:1-deoxy-D-xylulose-5-phosphate reductoisomerase